MSEEFEKLTKEISLVNWDTDVFLKALIVIELRKLNNNLSKIDFTLEGIRQNG